MTLGLILLTKSHVQRNAFLLTGGDKKGKNQKKFYKDLIAESETIIERHEKEIEK